MDEWFYFGLPQIAHSEVNHTVFSEYILSDGRATPVVCTEYFRVDGVAILGEHV